MFVVLFAFSLYDVVSHDKNTSRPLQLPNIQQTIIQATSLVQCLGILARQLQTRHRLSWSGLLILSQWWHGEPKQWLILVSRL